MPAAAGYGEIEEAAHAVGLIVMGTLVQDGRTLVLLGAGADFWPAFQAAPEARDTAPDPVDRWSLRVVGALAARFGAQALFPFGGPPYQPFIAWARQSGRAFQSPVGMLVHDRVGLMISYRGALHLPGLVDCPAPPAAHPCHSCAAKPCTKACPVGALAAGQAYDLDACHGFLETGPGQDCMERGCAVRRACPLSAGAGRVAAQSHHHMKAFHKR
ncbi:ferredoxin [Seohaeicola nanhaiensis]|uniref:Ferredoxin n=1 Tax=Seohaeicola nanhaiensis TaxID=1387282 RepID=A0ABV9KI13_9RHOB